jgi:hypothetical protein
MLLRQACDEYYVYDDLMGPGLQDRLENP